MSENEQNPIKAVQKNERKVREMFGEGTAGRAAYELLRGMIEGHWSGKLAPLVTILEGLREVHADSQRVGREMAIGQLALGLREESNDGLARLSAMGGGFYEIVEIERARRAREEEQG